MVFTQSAVTWKTKVLRHYTGTSLYKGFHCVYRHDWKDNPFHPLYQKTSPLTPYRIVISYTDELTRIYYPIMSLKYLQMVTED